ncbi:MAG: barstar family protein [Eubacteriales bacterium]|nr:barstar family protein [Eubacteriales bacterium]
MQEVLVKGREFGRPEDVHAFLADKLGFPEYYGRNFSALYDVLTEICDHTRIAVDLTGIEAEEMQGFFEKMLKVMSDAADSNRYLEVHCMERR